MPIKRTAARQGIQSIEVGGRLLEALAAAPRATMLRDLAAAAEMPAAKAHRYLVSFVRMGLVEQEPVSGRYDLGPFALQLGLAALARLDPLTAALPVLAALVEEIDQPCALAVWGTHGATIVRWLESSQPVNASLRTGSVMPLTRSATGRAFLAFLPPGHTARRLKEELAANARGGVHPATTRDAEKLVALTRRHGIARAQGEHIDGINGLAAPVFDASGTMALAVVALGYSGGFDASWDGANARAVRAKAEALSARLGYRPGGAAVDLPRRYPGTTRNGRSR